ncbi:unnamed protein product [Protopolystoma xenopodis]|uniref:Uncharacterized protein n=1 Tax=Protopolystoma xenopodis TaxID=117903 RepID=A0A448WWF3_9PLAT|nr:unnamed protein product [Protopolystoma xenopodis]
MGRRSRRSQKSSHATSRQSNASLSEYLLREADEAFAIGILGTEFYELTLRDLEAKVTKFEAYHDELKQENEAACVQVSILRSSSML